MKINPEVAFMEYAKSKGYTRKVVGDNVYTKRNPQFYMKLHSARDGKLQIFETGVGRYEINY